MAHVGKFAGADHPHIENWIGANPPAIAATMLEINAHGRRPKSWESAANYGFLDGHAETLSFSQVFRDLRKFNRFDPALAR
jgi:prepilin-type processing-associated H-X9-DG protein